MISHGKDIKVFSGNANPKLAEEICKLMEPNWQAEVGTLSPTGGDLRPCNEHFCRGSDVFVVQSTCTPVNNNLMELLIMIDALKRASAGWASPRSSPTTAMPGRTARPRPVTPSPPSWWPTCSPPRARTGC